MDNVWDDSALIRAYEDGVVSFQEVHDPHGDSARNDAGGHSSASHSEASNQGDKKKRKTKRGQPKVTAVHIDSPAKSSRVPEPVHSQQQFSQPPPAQPYQAAPNQYYPNVAPQAPPLPPELAQDPLLANLALAWYYSGYWTGYYQATRM
eukprot:c6671_g1_i1.p1 GENE.c6671_g1_i1~~c6671_g1_i1.p1  ORF type:complete len:161 (-),score=20.98 c6671_g1_i1:51-497(-)